MKLLDKFLKYDGFLKVFKNTYDSNGTRLVREVLSRGNSVAALVHNLNDNKFYFVSQPRPATLEKSYRPDSFLEVPAGMIDKEETAIDAVLREIKEELGFTNFVDAETVSSVYLSPGRCDERIELFYVQVTNKERLLEIGVDDEQITIEKFTEQKMKDYMDCNLIEDAKTLILLQWYFLNKK